MTLYAEIAINAAVPNAFHYAVPDYLEDELRVGHLVNIGLRNIRQHGIVLRLSETSPVAQPKFVAGRLDPKPVMSSAAVDLAWRLSEEYLAPIGLCAWLWLPPNLPHYIDHQVNLLDKRYAPADAVESEVFALLGRRGPLRYEKVGVLVGLIAVGLVPAWGLTRRPIDRPLLLVVALLALAGSAWPSLRAAWAPPALARAHFDAGRLSASLSTGASWPYELVVAGRLKGGVEAEASYTLDLDGGGKEQVSGDIRRAVHRYRTSRRGGSSTGSRSTRSPCTG